MERSSITVSRISAVETGVHDGIGADPRSASSGTPAARVRQGDRVTLSPEGLQYQASSQLMTASLDATERQVSEVLERAYSELYERAGKSDYMASIADTSDRSADATAGRILGGITGYIYRAYQMGHADMTAEQLDTFQTQVLKGFHQGLGDARQMIGAAGLLDPAMTLDIGKTEDLVHRGLEAFFASEKERLFPDLWAGPPSA
jgi:hypothetical protein